MMRDDIEAELDNWARWKGARGWFRSRSSLDADVVRSPRSGEGGFDRSVWETPIPVRSGRAYDVDRIIESLPDNLRRALRACYLDLGPRNESISLLKAEEKAHWIGCALRTYEGWLAEGRKAVGDGLDALRWLHQRGRTDLLGLMA